MTNNILFRFAVFGAIFVLANQDTKAKCDITSFEESFSGNGGTFDVGGWSVVGQGQFATNVQGDQVYSMESQTNNDYDAISRTLGAGSFRSEFRITNPLIENNVTALGILINDQMDGFDIDEVRLFLTESFDNPGQFKAIFSSTKNGELPVEAGELLLGENIDSVRFRLDHLMDQQGTGVFSAFVEVNESGNFMSLGTLGNSEYGIAASTNRQLIVNLFNFGSFPRVELDQVNFASIPEPNSCIVLACALPLFVMRIRSR